MWRESQAWALVYAFYTIHEEGLIRHRFLALTLVSHAIGYSSEKHFKFYVHSAKYSGKEQQRFVNEQEWQKHCIARKNTISSCSCSFVVVVVPSSSSFSSSEFPSYISGGHHFG